MSTEADRRRLVPATPTEADLAEIAKPLPRLRDVASKYDRFGRKQARATDTLLFVRAIPGLLGRMRTVPRTAVVEERLVEDAEEILLACPCTHRPVVPRDELRKCPGCERWYWWMEPATVYVLYGNMPVPGQPPEIGNPEPELES